ncbi:HAD-IA family hydrolase [Albimonas pacifica]|uniref:Phosphoglycolate phosphatase n=1 Tax=Albimonas pacifica TaxID=1114924 RepID=A0A1I3DTF1_9RHOB|nr:HAD-IA family hydrolase [Albimonas pacifica]SFH90020.1 phosphoglycolate phosphatase [Albimonas pacifica]
MTRGALFDLDGTLADTSGDLIAAANATLAARGASGRLDRATDAGLSGKGGRAMLRAGLARSGAPAAEVEPWVEAAFPLFLAEYEAAIAVHSRLFEGVETALETLAAAGWRLAVCTNKPEGLARILLAELGVLDRFAALVGADTLPVRKPDPRPVWAAADRAGAARGRSVMVGDTTTDREAARAAGLPCILMDMGVSADVVAELDADAVLARYADLPAALERLRPPA